MEDCKDKLTPLKFGFTIPKNTGPPPPPFHNISYTAYVGVIGYIANSRPDLAYALRILASHSSNPSKLSLEALNHTIAYLKTTRDWVLTFGQKLPFGLVEPQQPTSSTR
jgi:hypothetical protein